MRALITTLMFFFAVHLLAEEAQPGKQVEQELKVGEKKISYLLYLPADYASKDRKWPLMLFLHGAGERGASLEKVRKWGPPKLVERGEPLPFLIASPQCPEKEAWGQPNQNDLVMALLEHLEKSFKVDSDHIYLTGLSMGGFGSWRLAADHPERFAAVVPICGGGKTEDASKLKNLPIWVFHGTVDQAVPVKRSIEMVDAIKQAGGTRIRFTTLEEIGHNSWEAAYASPDLYAWLAKQDRTKNQ